MKETATAFANIDALIDCWCERRELAPLRLILPVYPLASGLTDEWQELYRALRLVRSQHEKQMPAEERELLGEAIVSVGDHLHGAGP